MTTKELTKTDKRSQKDKWDEMNVPTLTNKVVHQDKTKEEFNFDIIEDFIPSFNTATGHQEECSCIKCQPKKGYQTPSALSAVALEKNIQPLNKKKYD